MKRKARPKYRFPWRRGNRFELLVDGDRFVPAILAAIDGARYSVLVEMYLMSSGGLAAHFIDALRAAAQRGVRVHLLLDDFGARLLSGGDRHRLDHPNIRTCYYNPWHYGRLRRNLFRDHRKLVLVDGVCAFTGGFGIADVFDPRESGRYHWHEVVCRIEGPCVNDWGTLFGDTWNRWSDTPLDLLPAPAMPLAEDRLGRVTASHPSSGEINRSTLKRVRGAERRVWLATAYFVPTWKLRRALRTAARNDADVRLLLPGPHTDHPAVRHAGRRFYARLLNHGVRIFEYQPRLLHSKVLLCDDWTSLGSSNVDRWNQRWNLDANQEVEDQAFAAEASRLFEHDFELAREIHAEQWRKRPWHDRLREWFWGRVDAWVDRQSR